MERDYVDKIHFLFGTSQVSRLFTRYKFNRMLIFPWQQNFIYENYLRNCWKRQTYRKTHLHGEGK